MEKEVELSAEEKMRCWRIPRRLKFTRKLKNATRRSRKWTRSSSEIKKHAGHLIEEEDSKIQQQYEIKMKLAIEKKRVQIDQNPSETTPIRPDENEKGKRIPPSSTVTRVLQPVKPPKIQRKVPENVKTYSGPSDVITSILKNSAFVKKDLVYDPDYSVCHY
jgi:hypothetical protein